ncbi:MAG TPA: helix-turn-helix transcriptional regulator [Parafilimonas sp.]|nr:helix-turn-helix transcriptional regulator [Parafilimonas sp.]
MYFNALIFIVGIGIVQALLLTAVFLSRKKIHPSHILINTYIAIILLQLVFKLVSKVWLLDTWLQAYLISYFLPFLYGPLLLLFALSYTRDEFKWKPQYALHFVPFLVYLGFYFFADPQTYPPPFMMFLLHPITRMVLQLISLITYHLIAFEMATDKKNVNKLALSRRRFLKKLSFISFAVTVCISVTLFFLYTNYPDYQEVRWVFSLLTLFIYWLSYETFKTPRLFKLIHGNANAGERLRVIPPLVAHSKPVKYYNSGLKGEEVERISAALAKNMDIDKVYLDAELTIEKLSGIISCLKHNLSQVLNQQYHVSFNEFINQKRVAEARKYLSDPNRNHLKIASIAYDCGFNSLSSFNSVFKKLEGSTPSQFRFNSQQHSQIRRV